VDNEIYKMIAENLMPAQQVIQAESQVGKGPGNLSKVFISAVEGALDPIPAEGCHFYVFVAKDIVVVIEEPADLKTGAVYNSKKNEKAC